MKAHKVVAKKAGKVVGEKDVQLAENIAEATTIAGSAAKLVEYFNRQYISTVRNSLVKPATGMVALKTRVSFFEDMLKAGVPEAKALEIAKLTKEEIAKFKAGVKAA